MGDRERWRRNTRKAPGQMTALSLTGSLELHRCLHLTKLSESRLKSVYFIVCTFHCKGKKQYKQMLLKKTILWSCWACHPGRPGNLIICSNTSYCQLSSVWASAGRDEAVISGPAAADQLLGVDIAPVLAPILPEQKTPSPGHKSPTPFSITDNKRSGQQSLHFPHCLGRPTGPWVLFDGVHSLLSSSVFKAREHSIFKSLSLPLILTLLLPPL